MKLIPLTCGKYAIVDDKLYLFLMQYTWRSHRRRNTWYARTNIRIDGKPKTIEMQHLIMGLNSSAQTDHKNRNGLDNRLDNLRECTIAQNRHNSAPNRDTTSEYKGVCWDKRIGKWRVQIEKNKKKFYLGLYGNEELAAKAYDIKAKELFGEFAYLNFP